MIEGCITTPSDNRKLITEGLRTTNMWDRMRGLLGREQLTDQQALWISPCPSVHTIGMRYAIDVIFLSKQGNVQKITSNLKPLKFSSCVGAFSALELNAGMAEKLNITQVMLLQWEPEC